MRYREAGMGNGAEEIGRGIICRVLDFPKI